MSAVRSQSGYRIGEIAAQVGVTTRTIRYYEELGLLEPKPDRAKGKHRVYTDVDVARIREILRLRDLLGLSLEELVEVVENEAARAALRDRWEHDPTDEERLAIPGEAMPLVRRQLALVRVRQNALSECAAELEERLSAMVALRRSLRRKRR